MRETINLVKYKIYSKLHDDEWVEEVEVPYGENVKSFLDNLINEWNEVELDRKESNPDYQPDIRKITNVLNEEYTESKKELFCDWEKQNLVTIKDSTGMYDLLECRNCGIQTKQFQLTSMKKKCYPERTCPDCHKIYKDKKQFSIHVKRYHNILKADRPQSSDKVITR